MIGLADARASVCSYRLGVTELTRLQAASGGADVAERATRFRAAVLLSACLADAATQSLLADDRPTVRELGWHDRLGTCGPWKP